MIQRRRPIESAIAERKMFNMGGMAVPMPQPTYMDLIQQGIMGMPQQPMGMPQQPQGIMASSQPLVDAIAADANNPAGGDTLSMAQGGAVGFDQGGISIGQAPQAIQIPTLTPTLTQQGGSAVFDPANPITMSPKSIMDEAPSERVQRIFPDAAANVGKLTFDREFPEFKRDEEAGRPKSYFTEGAARVLQGGRAAIRDFVSEVGQDISAISNVLFGGDTRSLVEGASSQEGLDRVTSEIGIARAVAEMIQRRPDAENQIMSLSKRIINNAKTDGTELDGQKIAEAVAYGLTTGEREQAIGYDMAQRDAERGDVDAGRSTDQGEFGGTPTAIEKPVPILQDDPNLGQEIVPAEGTPTAAAADVIEIPPTPTRPGFEPDDDSDVPRQGPFDVEGEIDPDAGLLVKTEAPASDAAAQVAEAFDKPMTKPEATKTIQDYKNKFLEAMPEYQGVSEEEKGYRFIEAGLRVMAGQSSNAIENISNGLKGLGAEFAKDEKEKRAYDRQVDLSAAKYGLENLAKDEVKAAALAKEKRTLLQKVFVVRQGQDPFTYQGRLLKPGDRSIPNVGSIQDGTFPIDKFQTETSFIDALKAQRAKTKAGLELLSKQVIAPSKMESTSKQYIADTMRLRTNVATQSLLSRALVELQKPRAEGPLGVQATARRMLLGFANALGKKEYAESVFGDLSSQKDFDDFTNRAVTIQIEGLINEGGKITDQERNLAKEIGGALSQGARSGIFEDPDKLERQISEFSQGLQRDSESRVRSINLAETRWDKHFRSMGDLERGYSYGDILKESRAPIGGQGKVAPISSRILPKTLNYRDIIIIGDDGKVKGFNPNWNIPK